MTRELKKCSSLVLPPHVGLANFVFWQVGRTTSPAFVATVSPQTLQKVEADSKKIL